MKYCFLSERNGGSSQSKNNENKEENLEKNESTQVKETKFETEKIDSKSTDNKPEEVKEDKNLKTIESIQKEGQHGTITTRSYIQEEDGRLEENPQKSGYKGAISPIQFEERSDQLGLTSNSQKEQDNTWTTASKDRDEAVKSALVNLFYLPCRKEVILTKRNQNSRKSGNALVFKGKGSSKKTSIRYSI